MTVPNGGLPIEIEFVLTAYQFTREFLIPESQQNICHNADTSKYLFDKVAYKAPGEQVTILVSAKTYKTTTFFWEDPAALELEEERTYVE